MAVTNRNTESCFCNCNLSACYHSSTWVEYPNFAARGVHSSGSMACRSFATSALATSRFPNSLVRYSSVRWFPLRSGPTLRPSQNSPPKLLHSAAPLISPHSLCGAVSSRFVEVLQFQCNHIIVFIAFPQVERVESRRVASRRVARAPPKPQVSGFGHLPAGLWAALLSLQSRSHIPHFHIVHAQSPSQTRAHIALTLTLTSDCSLHRRSLIEFSPLLAADLSLTRTMRSSRGTATISGTPRPSRAPRVLPGPLVRRNRLSAAEHTLPPDASSRGRSTSPLACCSFSNYCFMVFI